MLPAAGSIDPTSSSSHPTPRAPHHISPGGRGSVGCVSACPGGRRRRLRPSAPPGARETPGTRPAECDHPRRPGASAPRRQEPDPRTLYTFKNCCRNWSRFPFRPRKTTLSPGARISSPEGGKTSWPSARLMATTITPVRQLDVRRPRMLSPARRMGRQDGHLVHLDGQAGPLRDQLGELHRGGIRHQRDDPVRPDRRGQHDVIRPRVLQRSFLTVEGCSALQAMISSFGQSWRPVRVMKTFSASSGIAEDQHPRAADPRFVEDLLLGGIPGDAEEALRASISSALVCDRSTTIKGFARPRPARRRPGRRRGRGRRRLCEPIAFRSVSSSVAARNRPGARSR